MNNHRPSTVLKQRRFAPNISKCQYQACCNFFTTLSNSTRKYCEIHEYYPNSTTKIFPHRSIDRFEKQKEIAMLTTPRYYPKIKSVFDQ